MVTRSITRPWSAALPCTAPTASRSAGSTRSSTTTGSTSSTASSSRRGSGSSASSMPRRSPGPPRADQVGESLVGEAEGKQGAPRGLPTPELGELPQDQQQPLLDADRVGDRGADGEPVQSPQGALCEGLHELRRAPR